MYRSMMLRARLLSFQCILATSLTAWPSAFAQVAEEPKAVEEPKVVVGQAVDIRAAAVQVVEGQEVQEAPVAAIAVQAVQIVGEAMVEEGMDVAEGAVQIFAAGMEVDPQASKLQSKVAVDNALVRRVCKLDDEQLKQLESLDGKWVKGKAAAGKPAANFGAGLLQVFAGNNLGAVQPDNPAEASSRVTRAYKAKLKEILKPEQFAEYEKHVEERDTFRRRANAECIVSVLEDRLSLNDTQRAELAKSLTEWSGVQRMQATFYFQNQAYIPNLPASVLKALTATQRKILDGMQKADFHFDQFNDGQEAIFIAQ